MQNLDNIDMDRFQFLVFDELHNYFTTRLMEYVKRKVKYKMGLSATIEKSDGSHWKVIQIFNYNVFKYGAKEALNDDVLNPFNYTNILVDVDSESMDRYDELTQEINLIFQVGKGFNAIMRRNDPLKYKMLSKMNDRKQLVNNYYRKFDVLKEICVRHRNDKVIVFNQFNKQWNIST